MKKRFIRFTVLLLIMAILSSLIACQNGSGTEKETLPIQITDQAGRTVQVEVMPEKIVSLAPSNTEIVYALGLADRLVGVTEFCNHPEEALNKPKVGGFSTVDIEKVVEIQPDLILATNIHKDEIVPELERLNLTVIVLDPKSIDEIVQSINLIGKAAGTEDKAAQLTNEMQARIQAITNKTDSLTYAQRPEVFYLLWHDPMMTVGNDTRIHELIIKAGGENIAADLGEGYPTMSLEALVLADPQVIIADSGHGSGGDLSLNFALSEDRLKDVSARQNDKVFGIDSDLVTRPGPRIVEGLETMAKLIHPEIFGSD